MPTERPLGIVDAVEVTITRASEPHEHECPICCKVYTDACPERFYATACEVCDPLGDEYE